MESVYELSREVFFILVGPEPTSMVYELDAVVIDLVQSVWQAIW